jgi:antitoxin ParD1/3/4
MDLQVTLPENVADFIKEKVATGQYDSSSDVIKAALHLLQIAERADAAKLTWLRQAWEAGLQSGGSADADFAALKATARARFAASSEV